MFLTWSSFNNIRMLLMACMPIVIFYLIWLVNTSEGIRSEEGTLLDLICWPDGNAIPVIIACGSTVAVVIELYGLYQLFKAGLPKREYNVTNGLYYYVWALIIIIIIFLAIMFYSGLQSTIIRAKIKGGITKAMLRYSTHLPSKVAVDRLQTRFHCCGRVNYQEWFFIPWYTAGQSTDNNISSLSHRKFVADDVPYSCCSMTAMWPCIHHGITQVGKIYKYDPSQQLTIWEDGCEEKLIGEMMSVSWRFNSVMALIIIAMILQIIAVRYLHTAYKNGLHVRNQITCEAYLLRSNTDTKVDRGTKKKLFKKRFRQARTLQWMTATYHPKGRCATSSGSDFNSSDELLKPIYE
ncbi:photoreceptor outer segment membrane glycoprotein 2-like isoform X1 [Maniola jurtina]|uniref:photoreceptor outer segment membrane glycoprotein 2-like isoform X1 n=2 Tax=Maniola jurtina TaxID=191418 RepID=UPI001E688FE0|nr:photoreceptor outer segment membrane glycoprotein 2-like isoform X1 [Maniola jurtina]